MSMSPGDSPREVDWTPELKQPTPSSEPIVRDLVRMEEVPDDKIENKDGESAHGTADTGQETESLPALAEVPNLQWKEIEPDRGPVRLVLGIFMAVVLVPGCIGLFLGAYYADEETRLWLWIVWWRFLVWWIVAFFAGVVTTLCTPPWPSTRGLTQLIVFVALASVYPVLAPSNYWNDAPLGFFVIWVIWTVASLGAFLAGCVKFEDD